MSEPSRRWRPRGSTYRILCEGLDPEMAARFEAERKASANPAVEHLSPEHQAEREERERIYVETRQRERAAADAEPEQGELW